MREALRYAEACLFLIIDDYHLPTISRFGLLLRGGPRAFIKAGSNDFIKLATGEPRETDHLNHSDSFSLIHSCLG